MEMEKHDDTSSTSSEISQWKLEVAEKTAADESEQELTFQSALQVLGGFMLLFNSWGILNTFGVFQNYYKTTLIPASSDGEISWIGSVQAFFLLLGAAIVGRLFDAGYLHSTMLFGSVLLVFTTCMTSLSTKYYQLFLSQGIGTGIAVGILFVPGVACVATWFNRHRSAAVGIVASGSSVGAVIYPIVLEKLIPQIGFGWAVRATALLQASTLLISNVVMKSRLPPRKAGPFAEPKALKQASYTLYAIGAFFVFWGVYTPFFYATSYAEKVNAPANLRPYVLSLMNATSFLGRILPNFVADVIGPINMLIPTIIAAGALMFGWLGATTWQSFLVFSMLYGFFSGTIVSLPPACVAALTDISEMSKIGVRMGMVFSIVSFACLTGTPIAGTLILRDNGGYTSAIVFSGVTIFVGGAFFISSRVARVGTKPMMKI